MHSRSALAALASLAILGCAREPPVPVTPGGGRDATTIDAGSPRADAAAADARDPDDAGAPLDGPPEGADVDAPADAEVADGPPEGLDADTPDTGAAPDSGAAVDATTPDAGGPIVDPCNATFTADARRYAAILACLRDTTNTEAARRAAIDRFITEVEANEGFPIVDGPELVFVYVRSARWDVEDDNTPGEDFEVGRRVEPITLSGDLNGWIANGAALAHEGLDFFHVRVPAPAPAPERSGYKFVARDAQAATIYFSDPLSRRFDYDGFGRISFLRGGTDHGHLERFRSVHATRLANDRAIYVWLPPGYEQSTARYRVLYMHDGNNLFDLAQPFAAPVGSWEVDQVVEAELAAGHITPPIVVGVPNNAGRFDEYTQVVDDIGGGAIGGDAADYADFLVTDLKPRIDARFRTRLERENTGVLGSSLGGLVSFYIAAAHPDVFRFVGGMSSTFAWGRLGANNRTLVEDYVSATNLAQRDQVYYLDSGGAGPSGGCTSILEGSDNFCATAAMRDALVAGGVSVFPDDPNATPLTPADIDIYHWHQAGAQHTESAWRARLFRPLRLFLRP